MGVSKFNFRRRQVIKTGKIHLNRSATHSGLAKQQTEFTEHIFLCKRVTQMPKPLGFYGVLMVFYCVLVFYGVYGVLLCFMVFMVFYVALCCFMVLNGGLWRLMAFYGVL